MLEPSASRFWRAALQSGLANAQALQAYWDALPPEKRTPEHIDRRLARQAVQAGALTVWQAQQLLAGRSSGFKIDRYVLLDLIGQGGMGRVYLARDSRLNRRVALKILSPERVNNPRAIARFHREALVGAQLQHENLVRIYDEGESSGKCYLVMEYIEGKNIGQMIAEGGPLPPAMAARLAVQVAQGLEHAQRKGLIHRDVNPYNILVTRDGIAKLTDLGLAIDLADQDRVTRDGATVGTFDYVSPEQARHSHSVDTRSDLYSLGCSLYHMLTGVVPFPSASLPEKLFSHQAAEPEPIAKLAPAVPDGLAAVVARMMRKLPEERYATPQEVAQALEPFAEASVAGTGPDPGASSRSGLRHEATVTQVSPPPSEGEPSSTIVSVDPALSGSAVLGPAPSFPPPGTVETPPSSSAVPSNEDGLLGLGIAVNLGPEPPLSKSGTSAARSKPRPRTTLSASRDRPAGAGGAPWMVPAAGVLGVLAVLIGGAFAYRALDGDTAGSSPTARSPGKGRTGGNGPKPPGKTRPAETTAPRDLVVVSADDARESFDDLASAMRSAIGSRGYVVLSNRSPLKISASKPIVMSGNMLWLKAAEGAQPVIEVEIKGRTPALSTRSRTPLRIEGVTIVAKYVEPGPHPTAVIEAGADVALDRCAFRVEGPVPAGARGLAMEGGSLTATGCWFENFDRAIDVACYGGTATKLRQCLFVSPRSAEPDAPPTASGWAVLVRNMPGGAARPGRRLEFDHCSAVGKGFLEFNGFSAEVPLKVDLNACAVLADALISWGPGSPTRDALAWSGQNDLLDIRGSSWVHIGPDQPMPEGPANLDAWTRTLGHETKPVPPPLRFATGPASRSEHAKPADFAVASQDAQGPGADPACVGPGARYTPPAPNR